MKCGEEGSAAKFEEDPKDDPDLKSSTIAYTMDPIRRDEFDPWRVILRTYYKLLQIENEVRKRYHHDPHMIPPAATRIFMLGIEDKWVHKIANKEKPDEYRRSLHDACIETWVVIRRQSRPRGARTHKLVGAMVMGEGREMEKGPEDLGWVAGTKAHNIKAVMMWSEEDWLECEYKQQIGSGVSILNTCGFETAQQSRQLILENLPRARIAN